MIGFSPESAGGAGATFTRDEAALLSGLAGQIAGLVSGAGDARADPALERLLPSAYSDDGDAAAEFRRFTEPELVELKVANAMLMRKALPDRGDQALVEVRLDAADALAWLRTLTDIRLTLAVRLGIEDESGGAQLHGAEGLLAEVYDWLGYLQESLVRAVDS